MKFLISGGTGLIGTKLTSHLIDNGHSVNILSRRYRKSNNSRIEYFIWKPSIWLALVFFLCGQTKTRERFLIQG